MVFNTYEELMAAVEERGQDVLTLEVDMGSKYSQEYEDAKKELAQAQTLKTLAGNQEFLSDNIAALEARVASLKPEGQPVWIQFSRLPLSEWTALMKSQGMTAFDQYEKVLPKTFIGVYGQDPVSDGSESWEAPEPLTKDPRSVSSRADAKSILSGKLLHQVVQAYMAWQNSGGEVVIRPTKSGLV